MLKKLQSSRVHCDIPNDHQHYHQFEQYYVGNLSGWLGWHVDLALEK